MVTDYPCQSTFFVTANQIFKDKVQYKLFFENILILKSTRKNIFFWSGLAFLFSFNISLAQSTPSDTLSNNDSHIYRDFHYLIAPDYDLYNTSINTRTTGKLLHDAFTRGIAPKIENKILRNVTQEIWSFATIFSTMIWSHEFGHMLRARQVGGNFYIERYSFPVIHGRMELPPNHTLEDNALTIVGGFESNYMTVRDIQLDLYKHNSLYNDELSLSFAHRLMYPIYFTLIAPVDPELPETWINTMGDPIHWIKPLWQRSGNEVFAPDNTVNPDLVSFYKQAALFSLLWNFADLNFYREIGASFGGDYLAGKKAKYLIGDRHNGWGYGTFFNTSIIGAELNLTNYIRLHEKLYTVQLRYVFPFTGNGLGIGVHQIFDDASRFNMDIVLDIWNQEYYDNGFAVTTTNHYSLSNRFDAVMQLGYKTEGYLMGRILSSGMYGNIGLRYVLPQKQ